MSDKRLSRTAMREMGLMDDQQPREPDREPVTAAGRRLLEWLGLPDYSDQTRPDARRLILAVEAESVGAVASAAENLIRHANFGHAPCVQCERFSDELRAALSAPRETTNAD